MVASAHMDIDSLAGVTSDQSVEEIIRRRTYATGYMMGKKHGYQDAVEDSYPELHVEDVAQAVGDAITEYLDPHGLRRDSPLGDFA